MSIPALRVVMYHYVRDLPRTRFPRIKGMLTDTFRVQVNELRERYEMANLEIALAYLAGRYLPRRDLCLLTFDDGLQEHHHDVAPILAESRIQGLFFIITGCQEQKRVAPVHMNHFLTAALGFETYRELFLRRLTVGGLETIDPLLAGRTYPWDSVEIACFKYLFNFVLDAEMRDDIVRELFGIYVGDETEFSRNLYFSWEEACEMQAAGMLMGGHTHEHRPLAGLSDKALARDLEKCHELLDRRLQHQDLWPFCYPYGKKDSFDHRAKHLLQKLGFCCSFSTENGNNTSDVDPFEIRRVDCNRAESPVLVVT